MKMVQRLIFNLLLAAAMTFALPAVAQAEGGVAEQFNLAPGGTYYFDLSDQNIPGTLNPNLPDPTLRWVPFTYVGTINAYSLGPESSGDIFASDNAAVSDRSLFVAEHGVKGGAAWNSYNAADLIFGKDYQSGGVSYKLRSLSAGNRQRDGYQGGLPESNEWDRILEKNAGYIKNWYYKSYEYDYGYSWCQDTHYRMYVLVPYNFTTERTVRGFYSPSHFWYGSTDATHALDPLARSPYFFRPALEIRSDPSTVLKTVTFDMGAHGFLGTDTSLTSATVVYTGTITLPNFITDPGFTYFNLGAGWGELCWSDGTNFYEMGNEYDLPTGTTLTPAFRPVTEQYNLGPGGIYYFDLSDQNIPGTVHYTAPYAADQKYAYAPDSSLKWVPFTYVGTINAYSLDENSVGDASASDNAAPSDRSLFVSACDVTSNVAWDTLKEQGLIFGRDYQSGGVSYKLRSMSMGNRENKPMAAERLRSTLRMLPMYNEWDQMMDKDGVYHFKLWNGTDWPGPNYCMGQDTMQFDSSVRTSRNSMWGMFREPGSAITSFFLAFRPVLEITSAPSTVLKTVTFDLGADGTLGSGMPSGGHDITGFTVAGQVGDSIIDTGRHTVEFHMPAGTDVTGLTPTITVSANATIDPASGTTQNFSGPVFYRVIAQNGRARSWKVTCIVGDPAPGGGDGSTAHCHVGDKPDNLALTSATVVYTGSLTLPAITVENGFNYTGSGSGTLGWYDGDTFYEQGATVNLASGTILRAGYSDQSSENDITAFTVTDQVGDSVIDTANHTVEFHMPHGTDVTELTPTITVSDNATIDPASGTAQNFTNPVTYTVTAQDGTPQDWTVTCVVDPAATGSISGTVYDDGGGGGPIGGATVTANAGGADYTATTAADGTYTIIDVPAGPGYTVTASKAGYISDTEENVTVTVESTTTVNFLLATPVNGVIIGVAKDSGNNPISGVTVSLSVSGTVYQATTDGNGTYTISNVPAGSGYTVTASKAGYISDTEENVTVTAGSTTIVNFTMTQTNGGEGGGGGGSGPTTPATPAYEADVKAGNDAETTIPVTVDKDAGTASVDASSQNLASGGNVTVTMPSVPGVTNYTVGMPVANLTTPNGGTLTFNTDTGSLTLPSDMLSGITGAEGKKAEISIGQGDKSNLPGDIKAAIGDRPIIQLTLSIDGVQTDWSNPGAPVTVSIPYTPTAAELANPESIVIWYIDGSGNAVSVPNGRYDPATGTVTFSTTHFSDYAVAYNKVTFKDVAANAWYNKAVSFIAARRITRGTGNGNYSPEAKLTRAEFIVLMMRAYSILPDTNPTDNFSDAGNTYYTGYLAAAKRLGISAGVGNNLFAPEKEITRQEMFTLLYNALKVIGLLPQGDSGKTLSDFSDAGQIDSWAKDAMTMLVETGAVGGNNGVLAPLSTTTRAEMAQVLYNLLGK
jgi:hypothetical protein